MQGAVDAVVPHNLCTMWLSGNCRDLAIYGGGSEQAITAQIKIDALEQVREIENAIATLFENLDLVVEAFYEAAIFSVNKKVGDFLPPVTEQADKVVETLQATTLHLLYPTQDFRLSLFLG